MYIEGRSLPDAIRDLIRQHAQEDRLHVTFACSPENLDCSPASQTAVFRIVQEALTNVRRHSHSNVARVAIVQSPDSLRVEIEDWGSGFDPTAIRGNCFGIVGMQARAAALQGHVCITSSQEKARSCLRIPSYRRDRPKNRDNPIIPRLTSMLCRHEDKAAALKV